MSYPSPLYLQVPPAGLGHAAAAAAAVAAPPAAGLGEGVVPAGVANTIVLSMYLPMEGENNLTLGQQIILCPPGQQPHVGRIIGWRTAAEVAAMGGDGGMNDAGGPPAQ
jgi:hypothetical protein